MRGLRTTGKRALRSLINEYHIFVAPVILGGGTPFFPKLERRFELELAEARTFDEVVFMNNE